VPQAWGWLDCQDLGEGGDDAQGVLEATEGLGEEEELARVGVRVDGCEGAAEAALRVSAFDMGGCRREAPGRAGCATGCCVWAMAWAGSSGMNGADGSQRGQPGQWQYWVARGRMISVMRRRSVSEVGRMSSPVQRMVTPSGLCQYGPVRWWKPRAIGWGRVVTGSGGIEGLAGGSGEGRFGEIFGRDRARIVLVAAEGGAGHGWRGGCQPCGGRGAERRAAVERWAVSESRVLGGTWGRCRRCAGDG
jgi:hypothetical protein